MIRTGLNMVLFGFLIKAPAVEGEAVHEHAQISGAIEKGLSALRAWYKESDISSEQQNYINWSFLVRDSTAAAARALVPW